MSYIDQMKTEFNLTQTLNGAVTHATSGDACLDLFAVAGGMRYRKKQDQIRLFDRAYIENPELAMKLLFHLRDIRGGMGERTLFRTLLRHVASVWPESARKNVRYITEYGRWDDVLCLMDTPAQEEAIRVIRDQLAKDMESLRRREAGAWRARGAVVRQRPRNRAGEGERTRRGRDVDRAVLPLGTCAE